MKHHYNLSYSLRAFSLAFLPLLFLFLKLLFKYRLYFFLTFSANIAWIMRKVKTDEKLCNFRQKVNLEKGTFMMTLAIAKSKGLTRSSRHTILSMVLLPPLNIWGRNTFWDRSISFLFETLEWVSSPMCVQPDFWCHVI